MKTYVHVTAQGQLEMILEIPGHVLTDAAADQLEAGCFLSLKFDSKVHNDKQSSAKIISISLDVDDGEVIRVIKANILDS